MQDETTNYRPATLLNSNSDEVAFAIRKIFQNDLFKEFLSCDCFKSFFYIFSSDVEQAFGELFGKLKGYAVKLYLSLHPFQNLTSSAQWKIIQTGSPNFKYLIMIKISQMMVGIYDNFSRIVERSGKVLRPLLLYFLKALSLLTLRNSHRSLQLF